MATNPHSYSGRGLSRFRTFNSADSFYEIRSTDDIADVLSDVKKFKGNRDIFILGNGSNVFFKRTKIRSIIVKNSLPQTVKHLGGDLFEVSSSVEIPALLKSMYSASRDAPYYLASAPCQTGGAIAMNAGSGPKDGKAVSDFLESVSFFCEGKIVEKKRNEIFFDYRRSEFSGFPETFIVSAVFRFPPRKFAYNPIDERLKWAVENQDLSRPNCGSLCNKYDARIMRFARTFFRLLHFPAGLSPKKLNWAYNTAKNPLWLRSVLAFIKISHRICGKEIIFEIKIKE